MGWATSSARCSGRTSSRSCSPPSAPTGPSGSNRRTGKPAWTTEINQGGFPASIHPKNTHATSTLACDGQRLFVTFYNHESLQAAALDLDGKPIWQRAVGPFNPRLFQYGYGPSPTLYGETVIVAAEYDGQSYLAVTNTFALH